MVAMSPGADELVIPSPMSDEELATLKARLTELPVVAKFFDMPEMASRLVSHVLVKEIEGPNNRSLARYLFDRSGKWVEPETLFGELVSYQGLSGVRVRSRVTGPVENRMPDFAAFNHPELSDTVFFPELIARAIRKESIEPVIVREWLMRLFDSEFDPSVDSYVSPEGYLATDYTPLYSKLVSQRQMIFQSIHDIVEHSLQIKSAGWITASLIAEKIHQSMLIFATQPACGSPISRILPYVVGRLLDDLSQPKYYHSKVRIKSIDRLLKVMLEGKLADHPGEELSVPPFAAEEIVRKVRLSDVATDRESSEKDVEEAITLLIRELRRPGPFSAG